jgi:hypothetical protein
MGIIKTMKQMAIPTVTQANPESLVLSNHSAEV